MRTAVVAASLLTVATGAAIAQGRAVDLAGRWAYAVVTENGTGTPTVTITQKGDSLTGTYASARMGTLPFRGIVRDSTFSFAIGTDGGATLVFKGRLVKADRVEGTVDFGGMGGATFSGERTR
jgi:hypothetical protein